MNVDPKLARSALIDSAAARGPTILLRLSSSDFRGLVLEEAPDFAGDVALETTSDLAVGLALGSTSSDVGLGGFVVAHSGEGNDVEGRVELAVPVAVQAVTILTLPRVSGDRSDTAEPGVGRFGSTSSRVRPDNDEHCRGDVADAGFGNELGCGVVDELLHRDVVDCDLFVEMLDTSSNDAHRVADTALSDRPLRRSSERGASRDQGLGGETSQLAAKLVGRCQHQSFEFVDRSGARPDHSGSGHGVHTQGFSVPVMGARCVKPVSAKCFACCSNCVEFGGLGAVLCRPLVWAIELDHPLSGA